MEIKYITKFIGFTCGDGGYVCLAIKYESNPTIPMLTVRKEDETYIITIILNI